MQVLVNVQSYRIEKLQSYWAFSAMAKILSKTAPVSDDDDDDGAKLAMAMVTIEQSW